MAKRKCVLAGSLRATFIPPVDLPSKLLGYDNPRFVVRLFTTGSNVAGEVFFKGETENAARLREGLPYWRGVGGDEIMDTAVRDIAKALKYETAILSGVLSFSLSEGVFDFSTTIDCDDDDLELARSSMLAHYAFPFLQTLGTVADVTLV